MNELEKKNSGKISIKSCLLYGIVLEMRANCVKVGGSTVRRKVCRLVMLMIFYLDENEVEMLDAVNGTVTVPCNSNKKYHPLLSTDTYSIFFSQ